MNLRFVTFFVNRANGGSIYASPVPSFFCINKIGALFSTKDYSLSVISDYYYYCNLCTLPNFAHVYTNQIICDTLNWIEVSGSFIADSAYEYINIGVFFDINNIDTVIEIYNSINSYITYYLIDDIYVGTIPLVEYHRDNKNIFEINLDNNILVINSSVSLYYLKITDITSRMLHEREIRDKYFQMNIDFLTNGFYVIKVYNEKYNKSIKIFKF